MGSLRREVLIVCQTDRAFELNIDIIELTCRYMIPLQPHQTWVCASLVVILGSRYIFEPWFGM